MLVRTLSILSVVMVSLVALSESAAESRSAANAAPQLELVDYFGNTKQALVYDQVEAEYVLLRSGARLRSFKVAAISPSTIELFRPTARGEKTHVRFVINKRSRASVTPSPASVEAPIDPYAASTDSSTDSNANTKPAAPPPTKVNRVRAPAGSRATAGPRRAFVSRPELNKALQNLESLSREVELQLTSEGTRVVAIGEGTLPYRLGLRRGDIVTSVAGIKTTKLEDGADIYVAMSSLKKFQILLIRDQSKRAISVIVQSK